MKKAGLVLAVVAIFLVLFLILRPRNPSSLAPQHFEAQNSLVAGAHNPLDVSSSNSSNHTNETRVETPPPDLASHASSPNPNPAETNEPPALPPQVVVDNARLAVRDYRSAFGENPVGTNPEITAALMGKNPKNINFVTPESGLRVNEKGEMIDAYGTPFFFHQISGKEMEIRSAGPDRMMWTFDDLVAR